MANKYPLILDGSQIRELPDSSGISIGSSSTITDTKVGQWETAYGWGNHASGGYAQADSVNTSALVGNISASSLSGTLDSASFPSVLPAVNGSLLTNVSAGKILQVVSNAITSEQSGSAGAGGYNQVSAFNTSITPSATSSKILILMHISVGDYVGQAQRLTRDGSAIFLADADGSCNRMTTGGEFYTGDGVATNVLTYVDSPNTTSSVTYGLQAGNRLSNNWYINGNADAQCNSANKSQGTSHVTLMEIGA